MFSLKDIGLFFYMANRILRDWTASEKMNQLSPYAEVFFTRLIMKADDYGAFHAHPKLILSALFPLKDFYVEDVESWLDECITLGLITRYNSEGKDLIQIENFGQRLQNMKKAFPRPNATSPEVTVSHGDSPEVTARNETKRNEGETKYNAPEVFGSNAEAHQFLSTNFQDVNAAKKTLENLGWPQVGEKDVGALAYHFIEKNIDILSKPREDVRKHFQNWLNKVPVALLINLSTKIQENHERKRRPA